MAIFRQSLPRAANLAIAAGLTLLAGVLVWRRHDRRRFLIVSARGVDVLNFGELETIPFDQLSQVAIMDAWPWIKRTGEDRTISLRGLFDDRAEREFAERAISVLRAAKPEDEHTLRTSLDDALRGADVYSPAKTRVVPFGRRLLPPGLAILAIGLTATWAVLEGVATIQAILAIGATLAIYAGIPYLLARAWRSDRRKLSARARPPGRR